MPAKDEKTEISVKAIVKDLSPILEFKTKRR